MVRVQIPQTNGLDHAAGFLRPGPDGGFDLNVECGPEELLGTARTIHGYCPDGIFVFHKYTSVMFYAFFESELHSDDLFTNSTPTEGDHLEWLPEAIRTIYVDLIPASAAQMLRVSDGTPISYDGVMTQAINFTRIEKSAEYTSDKYKLSLNRLSDYYQSERLPNKMRSSDSERITLAVAFEDPVDVSTATETLKALKILLHYGWGSPRADSIRVAGSKGSARWHNSKLVTRKPKTSNLIVWLSYDDVSDFLRTAHDFIDYVLPLEHVVEVFDELISREVSTRYAITLLGTAIEHVFSNRGIDSQVGKEIYPYLEKELGVPSSLKKITDISWNTYDKLKHRNLRDQRRVTIDVSNDDHAELVSDYLALLLLTIILNESGYPSARNLLIDNIAHMHDRDGEILHFSRFVHMATQYS